MILAEQQPSNQTRNINSVVINVEATVTTSSAPASQEPAECQQLQLRDGAQTVVAVDVQENPADQSAEDDEEEDSESSSSDAESSSTSEDEASLPVEELKRRGWLDELPQSSQHIQHVVNGLKLSSPSGPKIDKVVVNSPGTVIVGDRSFFKGPVTILTAAKPERRELNGGLAEEPKLSTGSSHPLYPFQHGRVAEWFCTKRCILVICVAVLVLVTVTVLSIHLTNNSGTESTTMPPFVTASPNDSSINNDPTIPGVRIVPRVEWGAQPPTSAPEPLQVQPPPYVIISHTASAPCFTQAQCVLIVRTAQTFHIESRGWDDIGYNFLVGGDGLVYMGRGWDVEGAHTYNYNIKSIGISFIGTFNTESPTNAQLHAAKKLIELGLQTGKIAKNYKLLGHRQCIKTESPGEVLYKIITTWEHWSPTP